MKASLINIVKIDWRFFRALVRWLLFFTVLLFILSGYGISKPATVESLTFGLLDKQVSIEMHKILISPFAVLLFLHILPYFVRLLRRISHRNSDSRKECIEDHRQI